MSIKALPETFTYQEAVASIGERSLRRLVAHGQITHVAHGVYHRADWLGEDDLLEIATRAPQATLCLRTALARHHLIDDIPSTIDVAVPRDTWQPALTAPVTWHSFDTRTFQIGRDLLSVSSTVAIGLYNPSRSIIDAFRLRAAEGPELGVDALRAWIRGGGQPNEILQMVSHFPRVRSRLVQTLEVLL